MYTPTVHRTYVVNTVTKTHSTQIQSAHEFKSRDEFFNYFFQNVANFMWNAGLVRVPDEAAVAACRKNAIPLGLGETHEVAINQLGTKMFCMAVPDDAHFPGILGSTLRVDVVADARVVVRLKHGSPPSRFTSKTAVGKDLGNHNLAVAAGPATKPPIQPGVWFVSVTAPSGANVKVGGLVFDDTDKLHRNLKLLGAVATSRTVVEDGGDEWEIVDDDFSAANASAGGGGGGAAAAFGGGGGSGPIVRSDSEAAAALALELDWDVHVAETLTQATDLLTLGMQLLAEQIELRSGVPPPPGLEKMQLAAMLFPLLPPPNFAAPASAPPSEAGDDDEDDEADGDVLEAGEHPDAFCCPITLELMSDPVYTADGHTYDRGSITEWLKSNTISPMTGLDLPHKTLFPNIALLAVIAQYNASSTRKAGAGGGGAGAAFAPKFDAMTGKPL